MGESTVVESSLLEKKIIRQIEYYFGDVNLPRDKFLKEKQTEDDGWVTIECLTTFNRLKQLSTDLKEICTALKKSTSGLLEINDEDLKIRRSKDKPLPDLDDPLIQKKKKMKTLYMKGFPKTYTMDRVTDFFLEKEIQTVFIKLRKDDDMKFKGSIFVETLTQEEADKLLEDKELKCEDVLLEVMKRDEYYLKKLGEKKGEKKNGDNKEKSSDSFLERKAGAVMHIKGLPSELTREDLKGIFSPIEAIAWVDFNRNETQGFIRFEEPGGAQRAIDGIKEKNDGKVMVKDTEIEVRVLEGEEEENYWKMTEEEMVKRRSSRGRSRGGGRSHTREKNFKRKRPWQDGPKKIKSEISDDTPKGEHVRFNDGGDSENKKVDDAPSELKKVKAEGKTEDEQ